MWEVAALFLGGGFAATVANTLLSALINRKKTELENVRTAGETKKIDVDAAAAITEAAVALVAPLKAEVLELNRRVESLETDLGKHKTIVQQAVEYIRLLHDWIDQNVPRSLARPVPPYTLDEFMNQ